MKIRFFQIVLLIPVITFSSCKQSLLGNLEVDGVKKPEMLLNGTWRFTMEPPENFWLDSIDFQNWPGIQVPGECQMQGFAIKHDQPFVYKHPFTVPEDYLGKQIFLNFHGVYSDARIWVNGRFVREHSGGFTKWSCNITETVTAGETAVLTIEVTDRAEDISYASGYAKHQVGGILRDVELMALPQQHFKQLWFETDLDENYENAELRVHYEMSRKTPSTIKFELFDDGDKLVERFKQEVQSLKGEMVIHVENPEKWDAEHPNLYKVAVTLIENGRETMRTTRKIGFREVAVEGNKLLVNGRPVKLRGANRHDVHPLLGRISTGEYERKDVMLAKEANLNFIRTSHYPPTERFLQLCDQYGLYVEDETAVCFVGTHRLPRYSPSNTENDTSLTEKYLSQIREMVDSHRNHPCVIIWSIGNESRYGKNFQESCDWIREHDPTRPVIFSYPGLAPAGAKIYDILSMHYPNWQGNLSQHGISTTGFGSEEIPMLFDEWAHVPCYNKYEIVEDPNVRNFWGQSLDSMWTYIFEADGGLGGAIWGMIDETFMLPRNLPGFGEWWGIKERGLFTSRCVGYGEWGIIDTWRRRKPEFWLTKKAYSPTKIYSKQIHDFQQDKDLHIEIHNRFDHTNFNELKITWKYGEKTGELKDFDLEPHSRGELIIPANDWNAGEDLNLCFFQNDTFLVDEYHLQLGEKAIILPALKKGTLDVNETENRIFISGKDFQLHVNKHTGLLENVRASDELLIEKGPYIHLIVTKTRSSRSGIDDVQNYAQHWKCSGFDFNMGDGIFIIHSKGFYDSISANFTIQIDQNGLCKIDYKIEDLPEGLTVQEAGLKFHVGETIDRVAWNRDPYFTAYPEHHLGRPRGEADLNRTFEINYREEPRHEWEMDTRSFYYSGLASEFPYAYIVRSLKENIYSYALKAGSDSKIKVYSEGTHACRFTRIDGVNILIIDALWDYPNLMWGNYMKGLKLPEEFTGTTSLKAN